MKKKMNYFEKWLTKKPKREGRRSFEPSKHLIRSATKEDINITKIRKNGTNIRHIRNPTPKMQKEAVKLCAHTIRYIENPTEEVQKEAIKQDPMSIGYIKDPTKETQLEAVKTTLSSEVARFIYGFINDPEALEMLNDKITIMSVIEA